MDTKGDKVVQNIFPLEPYNLEATNEVKKEGNKGNKASPKRLGLFWERMDYIPT